MKYIILLISLAACKQQQKATQRRLESWTINSRTDSCCGSLPKEGLSVETYYKPNNDKVTTVYFAEEVNWHPDFRTQSDEWYIGWVDGSEQKRLWSLTLINDTMYIMPTSADSIFKKANVISVAGRTFKLTNNQQQQSK